MGESKKDQASLAWLEDPQVFEVNRLPAHSDHAFYSDMESCREERQTLKQSLNGEWQFCWSEKPEARPRDFMKPGYDLSGFHKIMVPGHMELAGYGQIQYINTTYPWDGHAFLRPPFIDWENNPVGSYVREFDLKRELLGKRICISFQGAEEAIYVWLNGHFIGYGEDSFTPSDFDITEYVKPRGNRLCVEVYKRSSAAWIEDQDFFRFSGLFREVFLYGKPEGHVEDLKITADYKVEKGQGVFSFLARISGSGAHRLFWRLEDEDGAVKAEGEALAAGNSPEAKECEFASGELVLEEIQPWDVGKPYLYRLLLQVERTNGELLEAASCQTGFRHFEIRNNVMLLNGRRLLVNGVNRHEWSAETGRAITEKEMRRDIEIMKKNGINAVRTCHYPNQSLWYRLCDEAGICVMDETNLESHGSWMKMGIPEPSWNVPGSEDQWLDCCLDRAKSMYERDKNHASILWWSAGNESYAGTVIQAMCEYFHRTDPGRLVHYEGVFHNRKFDFITDVESRMYPSPESVREYLENDPKKPMVLCEYMHDMGNSLGGLEDYMKLREEFDAFHGGFLWDFIDQALYMPAVPANGERVLGYGGDFAERPTDYAFCANGLLFADRREKPAMEEVRYWYLTREERQEFDRKNEEVFRRLRERAKQKTSAFEATGRDGVEQMPQDCRYLKVIHSDCNLGLYGEGFHYLFSYENGGPTSLTVQEKEQLYRAPRPSFWRAPTENDKGCGFPQRCAQWLGADLYSRAVKCEVKEFGEDFTEILEPLNFARRTPAREKILEAEIRYTFLTATAPETEVVVSYRVNAYGKIRVSLNYRGREGLPELPAFGLQMLTAAPIEHYTWDGLSGETYPDRYKGAKVGTHTSNVEIPDYLVPQECGNHKDTIRLDVGDLEILMEETPFHCSVLPYTQAELGNAFHKEELPQSRRSVIRILGAIRGVGGIDSWLSDVRDAYHISGQEDHSFSFCIIPKFL